jgi:hypothetical protein
LARRSSDPSLSYDAALRMAVAFIRLSQGPIHDVVTGVERERTGGIATLTDSTPSYLLQNPDTTELMMDCCWAPVAFASLLGKGHVQTMANEAGASMAAHFWISVRTLLSVSRHSQARFC